MYSPFLESQGAQEWFIIVIDWEKITDTAIARATSIKSFQYYLRVRGAYGFPTIFEIDVAKKTPENYFEFTLEEFEKILKEKKQN